MIERADEAPALDTEQRNCFRVLRLSSAYDHLLHAAVTADNAVAVSEKESPCAKRRDDPHVGCGLPDKFGVVVFKILAGANSFRQAGRVRAERESGDKIGARAQAFHSVLHELVQTLNDRRHGNYRGHADYDAQHGQGRTNLGRTQRLQSSKKILPGLRQRHDGHQSDLNATTGSNCDARTAG